MIKRFLLLLENYNNMIKYNLNERTMELINPVQNKGSNPSLYQLSPCNSPKVGISPQNFLTFSFNPFLTLLSNFKAILSNSPKLLNLNQDHPSTAL